jgi:branched-chain amino acid transport system substrate-binding protein
VPSPQDFTTFWRQAKRHGYHPRVATISRAVLFPSSVEALGDIAQNVSTEVWWSPNHPFKSSLTAQTAAQLADTYTADTDSQWTQPIGFTHALFEVAIAALRKAGSTDRGAVINALKTLRTDTIVEQRVAT